MRSYLDLLQHVRDHGEQTEDRTGVGTRSVFGYQFRHDLGEGFPLLTTKKVFTRGVIAELLWFLAGETHNDQLRARGTTIWDEWATAEQTARFGRAEGDLGPVYGHQWRNFGATRNPDGTFADDGVDQIRNLIDEIRKNPTSRRLIVSAWNPAEADAVALPPCHTLFQFKVQGRRLSCHLYQRSADSFLGVPFNIASYALLCSMIAHVTDLEPGELIISFGDLHIYNNHFTQVDEQLRREPRALPRLTLNPDVKDVFEFTADDISVDGYDPHPTIAAPVAV